jgi:hypothetical protein
MPTIATTQMMATTTQRPPLCLMKPSSVRPNFSTILSASVNLPALAAFNIKLCQKVDRDQCAARRGAECGTARAGGADREAIRAFSRNVWCHCRATHWQFAPTLPPGGPSAAKKRAAPLRKGDPRREHSAVDSRNCAIRPLQWIPLAPAIAPRLMKIKKTQFCVSQALAGRDPRKRQPLLMIRLRVSAPFPLKVTRG